MTDNIRMELDEITQAILSTVETERIYLFGSYVNGTPHTDSDFDIYVVIPDGKMRCLTAMQKIGRAIFEVQKRPVDILVGEESSFERRRLQPTIEQAIAGEGVLLYANGQSGRALA